MASVLSDRGVKAVLAAAVVAVATGTIVVDGEVEVTLFMVGAVATCLICFDAALARRVRSLGPWLLVSMAPITKAVPTVWHDLNKDSGLSFERYDHAGSILVAGCVLGAVVLLARPAGHVEAIGARVDGAVIVASAVGIAVAAASVGFAFEPGFGSERVARGMEATGWGLAAAIVAATVAAISRTPKPRPALVGFLLTSLGLAAGLSLSSAGRSFDLGWWSLIFSGFAVSAAGFPSASLGERFERTRQTGAMSGVAAVTAVITGGAAIGARGDRAAWSPGWIILGSVSIGLFWGALVTKARAQTPGPTGAVGVTRRLASGQAPPATDHGIPERGTARLVSGDDQRPALDPVSNRVDAADSHGAMASATSTHVGAGQISEPGASDVMATSDGASGGRAVGTAPQPAVDGTPRARSRRAAAARTTARTPGRSVEPHHFDPATGLLSAAGLQQHLVDTFAAPHGRGDVALVLLAIRNLDQVESDHGRVNSAAISLEIADRLRAFVPEGRGARFARAAYALVITGHAEPQDLIARVARVLKAVSADVAVGAIDATIDVVAGMTQCYSDEDVARFVTRANAALERAVQTPEAALVVMP